MGLLDDAIREHLDLKRRRGADPGEIAREEAEALGPVRREAPAEPEDAEYDEGPYADHEPAALDEPAVVYDEEPEYEPEPEPEPAAEPAHEHPVPAEPPTTHDAPYPEREEESATPPHGDPLAHQATREFSATELGEALGHRGSAPVEPGTPPHGDAFAEPDADVVPADDEGDEPEAEDELDQTPDFLQETPEHDRLWFEQKPPKDFDF
jgi:hypothetical protein